MAEIISLDHLAVHLNSKLEQVRPVETVGDSIFLKFPFSCG